METFGFVVKDLYLDSSPLPNTAINLSLGLFLIVSKTYLTGELSVSVKPTTSIISSTYNRIITIDPYDPTAVVVNVIAKNS